MASSFSVNIDDEIRMTESWVPQFPHVRYRTESEASSGVPHSLQQMVKAFICQLHLAALGSLATSAGSRSRDSSFAVNAGGEVGTSAHRVSALRLPSPRAPQFCAASSGSRRSQGDPRRSQTASATTPGSAMRDESLSLLRSRLRAPSARRERSRRDSTHHPSSESRGYRTCESAVPVQAPVFDARRL